ncbi:MAG: hypothetical protein R2874_07545 [Desulfobacterales bacterium]
MTFKDVMYGRRAVNFFDPDKPVADALLTEMIELAAQARPGSIFSPGA